MKRVAYPSAGLLVIGLGLAVLLLVIGRPTVGQSPDSWRQLSLPDFVREIEQVTAATPPPSDAIWKEIRTQSAERLLAIVADGTVADYSDLVSLYLWGRPSLTPDQDAQVLAHLNPDAGEIGAWTFAKLRQVHARMNQALMPKDTIHGLTVAWLQDRDVRTLDDIEQLSWLFQQIQVIDREPTAPREFSVVWTGTVTAPGSSTYTFSICPFDLNFRHENLFRSETMTVSVDNQKVLDATQDKWAYAATPVALTGGKKTPLRIEFSYAASSRAVFEDRPAIALLRWQGPGMSRRLVPSTALSTPDGSASGLRGEYTLKAGGKETHMTRTDPAPDFIWYHGCFVVPTHQTVRAALAEQFYAVAASTANLAAWESAGAAKQETWIGAHWAFLESLDVTRQQSWAAQLAAHPVLLADCTRRAISDLYRRCRIGAPDEALQLVGRWAQAHADDAPSFATDFHAANRLAYRALARKMVWQYAPHLAALQQDYLTTAEGTCVLPVAYTLAYGHWVTGHLGQWIDTLSASLDDPQTTGDRRVNWLIARAQAEELRRSPPGRDARTQDHWLAGHGWLEEATLVATSQPVRLYAFKELAARLAADERIAASGNVLDAAGQKCTSSESTATLARWRSELNALEQAFATKHTQRAAAARDAYVQQLQTRYERALKQGDSQAAARYQQLLAAAGA